MPNCYLQNLKRKLISEGALHIVNASAGSGKTYTLVKEYLRIILKTDDAKAFKKVLAMTFTNKAANEMKERIIKKLQELSKDPIQKTPEEIQETQSMAADFGISTDQLCERSAKALNAILHNYGMFSVMTIDKFTHKIIRTFAKELGLSLDFDVELDLSTLRKNVTDLLFDQIGRLPELTNLMVNYANSNLADDKSWDFKQQLFEFSSELFKEDAIGAINRLKDYDAKTFIEARKEVSEEQRKLEQRVKKIGDDAMEFLKAQGLGKDDFKGKTKSIVGLFERFSTKKLSVITKPSDTHRSQIEEGIIAHADSPNIHAAENAADTLQQYGRQILEFWDNSYPTYVLNREVLKNLNNLSLMNHILQFTEQIKEEDNILLISDFYKEIAKLIAEEPVPFIYERLGVRYQHFLLDEFQDTSNLQWLNLIPLVHNSLAERNTNLIVGDGKQAIYRWRNGEVDQFVNLPDYLPEADSIESIAEAQQKFKAEENKKTLQHNFRSAPEIVNFNNSFFEYTVKSQSAYIQKIYEGGSQLAKRDFEGYVEVRAQENFETEDQCDYCLDIIQRSKALGYRLNDISILVKTNKKGALVAQFLSEHGIKVISQDSLWVSKDVHVKFLVALLSSVSSQRNLNHQKKCIEHLSTIHPEQDHSSLWKALSNGPTNIIALFAKYGITIDTHENHHSFYEYVEELITAFGFELTGNPYLQFFLEQVHQFEKKYSTNVRAFIQWFNEKGHKESITSPEGTEAVQVMTFHKSKGLQFPIVICPFLDWDRKKKPSKVWIEDDEHQISSYSLSPSSKTKLTKHSDLMEIEDDKIKLDHINQIYVAFTRPEIALFVCGDTKKSSAPIKEWVLPFVLKNPAISFNEKEGSAYWYGSFDSKQTADKKLATPFSFDILKDKMDRTKFSLKGDHEVSFENLDDKRKYGTELHLVLSKIKSPSEAENVLIQCLNKGLISPINLPKLKTDLERLFKDTTFRAYFEHDKCLNERIILDDNGKMHIPDKIIYLEDEILIVDYKTGEEDEEKHEKQLKEYIKLLSEIETDKPIRGEVFYTESLKVKQVQS